MVSGLCRSWCKRFRGNWLKDEVNPDYPHLQAEELREILQPVGWELVPRLPVYPQFDGWLSKELQASVRRWRELVIYF